MDETPQAVAGGKGRYSWYVLGVLVCVYMLHHLDRVVLSLLQEPIRHEFHLSDSQLALITGAAYAVAFGIAGLPLGLLVDRVHRVRLLAVLITIWSALTCFAATSSGYATLFLARIGVGAAESGSTPTNLSLLADYFGKARRSTAIGIYMIGPQLATLIGFTVTGVIAARFGWRAALLVAGLPGLLVMIVLLTTVREPRRQSAEAVAPTTAFRIIGADPVLLNLIAATTVINVVAAGLSTWLPSLLIRVHHVNIATVGMTIAFSVAPMAMVGTILAGRLTDGLALKRPQRMTAIMATIAALNVPIILVGVLSDQLWVTIGAFALHTFLHTFVNTPGYALSLGMVPDRVRGATAAVLQVLSNLIGFGVGPMVGGAMSDLLRPRFGDQSLRYSLAIFVFLSLWAGWHLVRASALLSRRAGVPVAMPAAQTP